MPRSQKGAVFCFSAHLHVIWRGAQELGAPRRRLAPLVRHSPASEEALRQQRLRRRRGPAQRRPAGASMPQRLAQHRRLGSLLGGVAAGKESELRLVPSLPANEQREAHAIVTTKFRNVCRHTRVKAGRLHYCVKWCRGTRVADTALSLALLGSLDILEVVAAVFVSCSTLGALLIF